MNKIINKLMAGGIAALAMTACTGDYENINSDPYQPDDLTPDDYALVSSMSNICSEIGRAHV